MTQQRRVLIMTYAGHRLIIEAACHRLHLRIDVI